MSKLNARMKSKRLSSLYDSYRDIVGHDAETARGRNMPAVDVGLMGVSMGDAIAVPREFNFR
ncbi:hypothetical protein BU25DRAFT_416197 [Macroventuria anomochaeta]|uniref:Uncharacterized protein n=1 Tax=Macroventuria anomochaeta TaxID=301207 RepID=A0ACB6RH58_9PLEO|nr:uncharacterized protein BU25DRAFT_416197 [Macroventuria anomochaeta]KAF2621276.1 hypothetical protein BU25DRAFT_416197 [Macroventuria anomochaeta]